MGKGTRNLAPSKSRPEAAGKLVDDEGHIFTSELHEAAWSGWVADAPAQPEITYDGNFALGGAKYTPQPNVKVRALGVLLTIARCADIRFFQCAGGWVASCRLPSWLGVPLILDRRLDDRQCSRPRKASRMCVAMGYVNSSYSGRVSCCACS
jgi:hypothetical protein